MDTSLAHVTDVELAALQILARDPFEDYELYVLRIAYAPGAEGRLARAIKRAELEDQLAAPRAAHDAPPYAWARRHIEFAQQITDRPGAA